MKLYGESLSNIQISTYFVTDQNFIFAFHPLYILILCLYTFIIILNLLFPKMYFTQLIMLCSNLSL